MANKPTLVGSYVGGVPVHQGAESGDVVVAPSGTTINADTVANFTPTQLKIYDLGTFVSGKPAASAVVFIVCAPRAFTLSASGHRWCCGTAATSAAGDFAVQKWNGSSWASIGTVSCTVGNTSGTASLTQTSFSAGELLRIVAPSSQNAALADIGIYLTATY
jgi:hypothetical protein